jgi:hypothetical protein
MVDVLIRDVPDEVIGAVDAKAKRLGLSRTEYLRRQLLCAASTAEEAGTVTADDLHRFAHAFSDLDDADVMRRAWQ